MDVLVYFVIPVFIVLAFEFGKWWQRWSDRDFEDFWKL